MVLNIVSLNVSGFVLLVHNTNNVVRDLTGHIVNMRPTLDRSNRVHKADLKEHKKTLLKLQLSLHEMRVRVVVSSQIHTC